jgi:PleD family two-component response regulator
LREAGLEVVKRSDSGSALETVRKVRPRVIIASFDSQTREDRLTFCRTVKADPSTTRIPIVLAATDQREDDTALATDPGVLVVTMVERDVSKLVAAVKGVLAAQRPQPLRASLRKTRHPRARGQ